MARTNEKSAVLDSDVSRQPSTNQSAFIRARLKAKPSVPFREVSAAWEREGNETKLNSSLFYQIRAKLGVAGLPRAGRSSGSDDEPNRSEYIRKNLMENPDLSASELSQLWTQEGFAGELKPALYYQVKRRLGMTNSRSGPRTRRVSVGNVRRNTSPIAPANSDRQNTYGKIERTLDQLIADAERLGDNNLTHSLRQARRRASVALV